MSKAEIQLPKYEDMIKAGMHFGRKKSIFHPHMKPFVYTLKEGIYILDLIKTSDSLSKAISFLKTARAEGKIILLVGTTKQSAEVVKQAAEAVDLPYVINRWLGGTLTNFKTIIGRVKHLEELETQKASGMFERYTKKEQLLKDREIASLRIKFDGLRKLTRIPDVIVLSSLKEGEMIVNEAKRMGVTLIGLVNTDSNPDSLNYPIPANDSSKKSVELIMEAIRDELSHVVPGSAQKQEIPVKADADESK